MYSRSSSGLRLSEMVVNPRTSENRTVSSAALRLHVVLLRVPRHLVDQLGRHVLAEQLR